MLKPNIFYIVRTVSRTVMEKGLNFKFLNKTKYITQPYFYVILCDQKRLAKCFNKNSEIKDIIINFHNVQFILQKCKKLYI